MAEIFAPMPDACWEHSGAFSKLVSKCSVDEYGSSLLEEHFDRSISPKQMQSFIHCAVGRALIVFPNPIDAASQVGGMTRWAGMRLISGQRECSFAFATKEKR